MLVAWLVYKTNSILSGLIIHFFHNSFLLIYAIIYFSGILDDYKLFTMVYPWTFGIIILSIYIIAVVISVLWFKRRFNLSSQRPITFISDYFRRKYEINPTPPPAPEVIEQ